MYQINIQAKAADGTQLKSVHLRHAPTDAEKITKLRESMVRDGWTGRAVLLADCGDHHRALTGTHRMCAAIGINNLIEAIYLPDDLSEQDWDALDAASDDYDVLDALTAIAQNRDDLADAIEVLRAEVESNNTQ